MEFISCLWNVCLRVIEWKTYILKDKEISRQRAVDTYILLIKLEITVEFIY